MSSWACSCDHVPIILISDQGDAKMSAVMEVNKHKGVWKLLASEPSACSLQSGSASAPVAVARTSKATMEAAKFGVRELSYAMSKAKDRDRVWRLIIHLLIGSCGCGCGCRGCGCCGSGRCGCGCDCIIFGMDLKHHEFQRFFCAVVLQLARKETKT